MPASRAPQRSEAGAAAQATEHRTCRKGPCPACPYRRDVPSGVWAPEEYEKLRRYDQPTGEQPWQPFLCHATPGRLCHGWAVVHTSRGHEFDLLALRLIRHDPEIPDAPAVPLFASGCEAADHGLRDIAAPSADARSAMDTLRRYPHLAEGLDSAGKSDPI